MTQFITIPCKKGYEIKFIDAIATYVRETYGDEQCNNNSGALNEFNNMRTKMLNKLYDKHESTIGVFTRYHDQLFALESKIPIEENGVRIDYKWDDAFGKESLFGKKNCLQIASGGYERICILFNIAAICSQVAETQNLSDDNGLKNAAKYLQQAAGIFSYLKSTVAMIIERETTTDLNPDTLSTLSAIMVAQAQELIYTKAARDQMKEANVAKIVQQTADLYADSLRLMQLNSVKSIWPKEWIPLVAGKEVSYHAVAEYYQAKACGTSHAFGEQIARLRKASELMKTASARAGPKFIFRSEQERIRKELETIEKENNMIYHDSIPSVDSLSPISKAVLARELPLDNPIDKDFKDLFIKIVPLALHSAMMMFQNKQKSLVDAEIYRLKEATTVLGGILASMNLPTALEDNTGDEVPHSLLEKAAALRNEGGINKMDELKNSLPDIVKRNDDLLKEAIKLLDEEEESDRMLREQFKDRWNRTPSHKLTEPWRLESKKFSSILRQAKSSDETIHQNYQSHSAEFRILSQNDAALKNNIPKSGVQHSSEWSQSIKEEGRTLYNDIESMKATRAVLITELSNDDGCSLANNFTKALAEDSLLNQEHLADEQLNTILSPMRERVRQSLDLQDQLLSKLQDKCSHWTGTDNNTESRAAIISSLRLAADKYSELLCNLQEGLKFYGDIVELLGKYHNKVKDFCFARKTEKDELMKDLISSTNYQATSAAMNNQRPTAAYQAGVHHARPNVPVPTAMAATAPTNISSSGNPYGQNMPTPYVPGVPPYQYPQYGYQPHQSPLGQHTQTPQYPSQYNYQSYPGYQQYYPR